MVIIIIFFTELANAIDVEITSEVKQSVVGEGVNISIRVFNDSTPLNNTLVNFTTTLGNLSKTTAYTNESGIAVVRLNSTLAGIAIVNVSVYNAYNTTNISFIAGAVSLILVDISHNPVLAGNITLLNYTLYDRYYNVNTTANLFFNITIKDVLGELTHEINVTAQPHSIIMLTANHSSVNFTTYHTNNSDIELIINSTIAGNISTIAKVESITNITSIIYTPASPHTMVVMYYSSYTVNTTSSITVGVYDAYENPVSNATVLFNATPPSNTKYNSPIEYNSLKLIPQTNITSLNGLTSVLFRTDKRAGDNIINISIENTSINTTIIITGSADVAEDIILTSSPSIAYANNIDTYYLSAQVVDKFLNPILPSCCPIKDQVLFTTALSSTLIPLNESGSGTTLIGPTPYIETMNVTARYKNESGETNITNSTAMSFIAGRLASFTMFANPYAVLTQDINGNHNATITIIALDEWGHALPNITITLNNTNISFGNLSSEGINQTNLFNLSTDLNGRVQAVFSAGTQAGDAIIIAMNRSVNASTIVGVRDEPFLSINISVEPENIDSGDIVNVTTIISVEGDIPITRPAASAMLVLDRSGSMDPDYYAGTPLDVVLVLDRSGSMDDDGCVGAICQPITDAKNASKAFMDNLVSNTMLGVVSYSTDVTTDVGLTPLSSTLNKENIRRIIDIIETGGWTNMGDAMTTANDILINNGRSYARKVEIVLTDGKWNTGIDPSIPAEDAKSHNIVIYTIGLGSDVNEAELYNIARETGGKYYHAPSSSDLLDIYNAIAQEITDYDISDRWYGIDGFTPYRSVHGSIDLMPVYKLSFEGYDFDTTFTYNNSTLGEVLIAVNGENITSIPSPLGLDGQWMDYEYNITDYVVNGSNNVSFYDYHALLLGEEWTNKVRNINIYQNGSLLQTCSAEQSLTSTAYNCSFTINITRDVFTYVFDVNETINDLKAEVKWNNSQADLDLQLKSPSGHIYGFKADTTGYYPKSFSEYVWVSPLSGDYPISDNETIETGNWTVNITGKGNINENFTLTIYIDKKSAVKIASQAFISSFNESKGDQCGLVLYSYSNITNSSMQSSYLRNNSEWVGYFEGGTPQKNYTLKFKGKDCDTPYNGYGECYITMNGVYLTSMPPPDVNNGEIRTYTVDISAFVQNGINNISFYDYHDIYSSNWWNEIKNVEILEDGNIIASYQSSWVDLTATPHTYSFNATFNVTTFNLTWDNASDNLDLYLYKGAELINYSNNSIGFEELSAPLYIGYSYHIVVRGINISSETRFNLTLSNYVDWTEWGARIVSNLTDSFTHLNTSISTMSADGLTAIDEGMYLANNELSKVSGNSTIVLMTDGIDNAGYHSMLLEANRAKNNHTKIYTIGFGNNESDVDPILSEIANLTGGVYYFAPNVSVLKNIFRGIAINITNFTANGPVLNLHIPHNYITNLSIATATYITNSSNASIGNTSNLTPPTYPAKANAEPNITTLGNKTILTWNLPNLDEGKYWGVWYQLRVEGAGYVPLILPTSNITYENVSGVNITVNITYGGGTSIGGSGADVNYIALGNLRISANPNVVLIGEPSIITITATYEDNNPAIANVTLYSSLGSLDENNITISGSDTLNFTSNVAGRARIKAIASNGNNTLYTSTTVVVKPKGRIILT